MKTQIITLAAHDDLISLRDRMSWAKAPRILLVWPPKEQVRLQPLDLRILQQRAQELGAELALVARGSSVRRDAQAFGIPVFRSTKEAQRLPWGSRRRVRRRPEPIRARLDRLRQLRRIARPASPAWTSSSAARLCSLVAAVVAVFAIASIFVPRATIIVSPDSQQQRLGVTVDIVEPGATGSGQSGLSAVSIAMPVRAQKSVPVLTRSAVATAKASGSVELQNLSNAPLLVPAGTIVYSLTPELRRYAILKDTRLEAGTNELVTAPIEALDAGPGGNLPAGSLAGAEGSLGASVAVTNRVPITGGTSEEQNVPSEVERNDLRTALESTLEDQARTGMAASLQEGDILLPESLTLKSIDLEEWDPPQGKAASVLSLTLEATYEARLVRGSNLRALAGTALDSQLPAGYLARDGSLRVQVNGVQTAPSGQPMQMQLDLQRTISRRIDTARASQLVGGAAPHRASIMLQEALALKTPPEIRLTPSWWPWMPLIPFRIEILSS